MEHSSPIQISDKATEMISTRVPRLKTKMMRSQLAQIDERLVQPPAKHPFIDKISMGSDAIPELVTFIEAAGNSLADRILALQALGAVLTRHGENPTATSCLTRLATAKDEHPTLRAGAGKALLLSGNKEFSTAFETRLASDDPRVAASAAHAMGVARRKEAIEPLIELFAKSKSLSVQSQAAWALGEIGALRALEILTAAFQAEHCLIPVIEALGKLGDEQTIAYLTVALRDANGDIRFTTAEAIHKLVTRLHHLDHSNLESYLLQALACESESRTGIVLISVLHRIDVKVPKPLIQKVLTTELRKGSIKQAVAQQKPS